MDKHWTKNHIPSQRGKLAVVTGANSGLGFHITKMLAAQGCRVVMACRNMQKGHNAIKQISKLYPGAKLELMKMDLSALHSVQQFAERLKRKHQNLDYLFNNAGVMIPPYKTTSDNFELQFGVNYLGHFALTAYLMDMIERSPGCKVIHTGSLAANRGKIHFDDLNFRKHYKDWDAYNQSKLAVLMFGLELDKRFREAGINAKSIVAHPGLSKTNLFDSGKEKTNAIRLFFMKYIAGNLVMQKADKGALPLLYAATEPQAKGGTYYGPDGWWEMKGYPKEAKIPKAARNEEKRQKLWEISEKLTGTHLHPHQRNVA